MNALVILVTTPDLPTAHTLAENLLEKELVACVNLLPSVVSLYKWQGQLEQSTEVQMIIKAPERNFGLIESTINELHPYDVPEIIALNIEAGSKDYLNWINQVTVG